MPRSSKAPQTSLRCAPQRSCALQLCLKRACKQCVVHSVLRIADSAHVLSACAQIVGYSAAALGFFFFVEWLIHLPGLSLVCRRWGVLRTLCSNA